MIKKTVRRFKALPLSVSLFATGYFSPAPLAVTLDGETF